MPTKSMGWPAVAGSGLRAGEGGVRGGGRAGRVEWKEAGGQGCEMEGAAWGR